MLDVRATAIYRLVERLGGAGLIEPVGTNREGKRPERTVYRITDEGRDLSDEWLRDMLAMPAREYPSFPAALSMAGVLPPDAVADQGMPRSRRLRLAVLRHQQKWHQTLVQHGGLRKPREDAATVRAASARR